MIDSRKTEIRYITDDPKKMLGKWVARRALKTWTEDFVDESSGKVVSIERNEILLERGTYISQDVLCTINFMIQEGSLKEVEVSNQNRQGMLLENRSLLPFKAVAKIDEFKALRVAPATKKRNKYGAKKSGGYDSKKEHSRANELKLMQRAGLISNLREQVKYVLIPA